VVSSTPRPHFTPGKDSVPILQEAGWTSGPVWIGGKSRPHRDSIPHRPARNSVAIPTDLPGPQLIIIIIIIINNETVCLRKSESVPLNKMEFELTYVPSAPKTCSSSASYATVVSPI